MFKTWWKIFKTTVLVVGVLLSFFVVIELIRAYQTLHGLHPLAAYVFLGLLVFGILFLIGYFIVTLASRPAVLKPVVIGNPNNATNRELRQYVKYLARYINRLRKNELLSVENKDIAKKGMEEIAIVLESYGGTDDLIEAIQLAEEQTIKPILAELDEEATKQIRNSTRDVMVGVVISPYKAADLLIVLYRNIVMVIRIIRIYHSRPRLRGQLHIISSIIRVVATVNYINVGKNLIEGLGSKVPIIGTYTDDIAQGIGAGLMTSVAGQAALGRCRAFKGWNEQEAKDRLRDRLGDFYGDVRDIFKKDILPVILKRVGHFSKESLEKIGSVLDETGNLISGFVKVPIKTALTTGDSVVTAGTSRIRRVFSRIAKKFRRNKG